MTGRQQAAFLSWGKCLIIWLLIGVCYLWGLKDFLSISEGTGASVILSSFYPDQAFVSDALKTEEEDENPSDFCFYWDGGMQAVVQEEYNRQETVLVAGLYGDASLYDWRAGGFAAEDRKGCMIDRETARSLFGSTQAEGGLLKLGKDTYEVRKVVPWKQKMILLHPQDKETVYTSVFIRPKIGESAQNAAEQFLLRHGLSGTRVAEGSVRALALFTLILLPAMIAAGLFCYAWKERKNSRERRAEYWTWTGACVLFAGVLIFVVIRYVHIPLDWIPGKWSDFQFWPDKIKTEYENLKLYLMLPKTVPQMEQILAGAKAFTGALVSFLLYLFMRKNKKKPS